MAKTINISKPFDTPDYCNFSIIIVNYNYEDHITQAIQSCIEQNYPIDSFEIIVVDDGSTDNSRAVIAETASKYQNLRVIHQNNLGQAAAFYAGVNSANNDWICLLDSDDYFKTEKLSVLNQYIRTLADNCDFICHDVDAVDEVAGIVQSWFDRQNIKTDSLSVNDAKGGYPYANPCGQVYRKTLLQKIAPWINPAEWMRGADNPLVWGAMFVSGRVHYLHQSLAVYRSHSNNFFLASTPNGLVPKVNWLERWPKLLSYLRYLNQAAASSYIVDGNRNNLLLRLEDFYQTWEQRLRFKPDVPMLSLITTCKNRLHHLKQTLPLMVKQPNAEVIVVDYGCTQGTRDWIKANYPQVKVVEVDDDSGWCLARARNLGAAEAKSDWLLFIDADVLLQGNLSAWVFENAKPDHFYRAGPLKSYSEMGTILCTKANYSAVGGYDEAYVGWAAEDGDFFAKLKDANFIASEYPSTLIKAIEHGDEERQLGKEGYVENTAQGMRVNMIYRLIKADIKKLTGSEPSLDNRKNLIKNLIAWTSEYQKSGLEKDSRFVMKLNAGLDLYQSTNLERQITYSLKRPKHIFYSQIQSLKKKSSAVLSVGSPSSLNVAAKASLVNPFHKIVMFHFGRSGSSVLADMLNQHPAIHWDNEIYEYQTKLIEKKLGYFKYGDAQCRYDPITVLRDRIKLHSDTHYGFEVKFNHLEHCDIEIADYLAEIDRMGIDKYITLERKNILRKIVSSLVAEKTNVWHVKDGKEGPKGKITICCDALKVERKEGSLLELLDHYTKHFNQLYALLEKSDIEVLKLTYEDDIEADPGVGFNKAIAFFGLSPFRAKARLKKTNPYPLSSIVENIDEVRAYLKNTPYAWMVEDAVPSAAPAVKKNTNPAPDLLLANAVKQGEDFLKFVALAHVFDHENAQKEIQRLLKVKADFAAAHPEWIGKLTLEQSANALNSILTTIYQKPEYKERDNWLGLSSGFDSRFLLHGLRNSSVKFSTFTFGERGYLDYDLPVYLSEKLSLDSLFIDLGQLEWKLALYEESIAKVNDKPVHARIAVTDYLLSQQSGKPISIIDGYPNNALIAHKAYDSWHKASFDFLVLNDQFKWNAMFDRDWLLELMPDKPLTDMESLSYFDQLMLCYRTQRARPSDSAKVQYLMPFADDDWIGFWLHRTSLERQANSLFLKVITGQKMEEFVDFNLMAERKIPLSKNEQPNLLYAKDGLLSSRPKHTSILPWAQICFYSLYTGSDSFKKMIDASLERLKKRGVFQPLLIEQIYQRFLRADPNAEKMMRGLVTCDVALEAGVFNQ